MSAGDLITDEELAAKFQMSLKRFTKLRQQQHWPCVRFGRFDVRFTEEQVADIVAMQTEAPMRDARPAQVAIPGQTARSAARRRSA